MHWPTLQAGQEGTGDSYIVLPHHNNRYICGPTSSDWCHTLWQQVALITQTMMPSVVRINIGKYIISTDLMKPCCLSGWKLVSAWKLFCYSQPWRTIFYLYKALKRYNPYRLSQVDIYTYIHTHDRNIFFYLRGSKYAYTQNYVTGCVIALITSSLLCIHL